MSGQTCDFCQTPFEWTAQQFAMDASLRHMGSALGAMCDACDDAQIAIEIKRERLERRRERAA